MQKRIRVLRIGAQMTQAELAESAGISIDALTRIESGERAPTLNTIASLAGALGVSAAELIDEEGPEYSPAVVRLANIVEEQDPAVQKAVLEVAKSFLKQLEKVS